MSRQEFASGDGGDAVSSPSMIDLERRVRLFIYRFFLTNDRCPTLNEIAVEAGITPVRALELLRRLQSEHEAIVLSPGSGNLWLADPFAALPTPYPVYADGHRWFGMCVWDALGILALSGRDGDAPTMCPISGAPLVLQVRQDALARSEGVVHFAVPAHAWCKDIGFT